MIVRTARAPLLAVPAVLLFLLGGCGGGEKPEPGGDDKAGKPEGGAAPAGRAIVVTATTDEKGSYFSPSQIEAHPGDTLRFTLAVGVHNVNFLADSNTVKTGLPTPTDMLQLPGQTIDIPLTFGKGTFYFQCDPHAALGMHGRVKVED